MTGTSPAGTVVRRSKRKAEEMARLTVADAQEPNPPAEEPNAKMATPCRPKRTGPPPSAGGSPMEEAEAEKGRRKRTPLAKMKLTLAAPEEEPLTEERPKEVIGDSLEELDVVEEEETVEEEENEEDKATSLEKSASPKQRKGIAAREPKVNGDDKDADDCFLGDPVPEEEARQRWPHRYQVAGKEVLVTQNRDDDTVVKAMHHYLQATVDNYVYHLNDDVYVKAGEEEPHYIGHILEFFETHDHDLYFTAQWFFRAEDTAIKDHARDQDPRRVFLSDDKNDNALNCIVKKVQILRILPKIGLPVTEKEISGFELYYDMSFTVAYSSFSCLPSDLRKDVGVTSTMTVCIPSHASNDLSVPVVVKEKTDPDSEGSTSGKKSELLLLDLFSGCGAMSTGLCLGANLSGVNLKTRWAVDMNRYACESLKFNHPEAEVRNEKAEDFLVVIREWEKLCQRYGVENENFPSFIDSSDDEESEEQVPTGEFEVGRIVGICYGKTENLDEVGLKFKVRWKGYGPSEDTWEPVDGLRVNHVPNAMAEAVSELLLSSRRNSKLKALSLSVCLILKYSEDEEADQSKCQKVIKDFVRRGYKRGILPLPGSVDVICGGPPCQGMSGFNRFRQKDDPFKDVKNKQMAVFMQIVEYLKPKFVLMENVVDILKFAKGYLGRYALSQLVAMKYQARLGILAAGNYGLPQYRMRVFLWGAHPAQTLPQFPLPTHEVVTRGGPPVEFETNVVAYDGGQQQQLEKALRLSDAISDLPPVENDENRDEMNYVGAPTTDFQHYIRLSHEEMMHPSSTVEKPAQDQQLFDHRPLRLNDDDYQRVCRIPKHKGANFRNLPGVIVGPDNIAQWDPEVERVLLPSGKPLVPDYAMSFINGKSLKPFGRLWWDETVPTVVTRAEPHNQIIIHPEQDRVLSVRENARLQGFPDYYKLFGPIKERYIQVGNAVAVPVSRALGYAFGVAYLGKADEEPVLVLPQNFSIKI